MDSWTAIQGQPWPSWHCTTSRGKVPWASPKELALRLSNLHVISRGVTLHGTKASLSWPAPCSAHFPWPSRTSVFPVFPASVTSRSRRPVLQCAAPGSGLASGRAHPSDGTRISRPKPVAGSSHLRAKTLATCLHMFEDGAGTLVGNQASY